MKKVALFLTLIILASASYAAFDKKITFKGKTLAPTVFDHGKHMAVKGTTCKACHPAIFKQKAGTSKVTMAAINKGKFCAVCHKEKGKAFAVAKNCAKCHVKEGVY
ncbi:hypothetical protein A3H09_03200 [Candidatus Falkowbacteria bacterium RIFCSPLOWO2_12_FULL_45_13]|uniref:Cytochrome c7-like domain-containing protein n=1 Tax=Candidatus Falkowbacteria bacterium RIFCSPLOWO2_12_FULL_45_13 TaxID=1797991 RepID=A0A1F5SV71_9BACT|nr:MAG: hypothetical protein A3H09_03200 [Candidatus Falkowbacteria bacterium RIFCSPLOWO2_12_FULL_45_13]